MSEILGLIDTLESRILEAKKLPFTTKVVIEENHLLEMVDKLRLLLKNQDRSVARESVDLSRRDAGVGSKEVTAALATASPKVLIEEAENLAATIRKGANEYADNVLARLQLLVTKLQKNLIRLEKNIDDGRQLIEEAQKRSNVAEETPSAPGQSQSE